MIHLKRLATVATIAFAAVLPASASAAPFSIGNAATPRANLDTFYNFIVADASSAAASSGFINQINWYAQRDNSGTQGSVAFAIVHPDSTPTPGNTFLVKWISANQPLPAASGAQTLFLGTLVPIAAGDELAVYQAGTGVVPFDYNPAAPPDFWAANNSGEPTTGQDVMISSTSTIDGQPGRNYSMNATSVAPTTKDQCKQGGWQAYTDSNGTPFKNQGDCVSFVATGGRNLGNG